MSPFTVLPFLLSSSYNNSISSFKYSWLFLNKCSTDNAQNRCMAVLKEVSITVFCMLIWEKKRGKPNFPSKILSFKSKTKPLLNEWQKDSFKSVCFPALTYPCHFILMHRQEAEVIIRRHMRILCVQWKITLIRAWAWNTKHSVLPKRCRYFLGRRYYCLSLRILLFILESATILFIITNTLVFSCLTIILRFKDCYLGLYILCIIHFIWSP